MSEELKVSVMLAAQNSAFLHDIMLGPFFSDGRFRLSTNVYSWEDLTKNLEMLQPELLVVNAAIAPSGEALVDLLSTLQKWHAVALVLLPPEYSQAYGLLSKVSTVRQIYTLPQVSWPEVVEAGWLAVNNERARRVAATPLRQAYSEPSRARSIATGTRVIAFLSARGGTGRSTIAEALGYELAVRNNLQTLLLSCDLPPAATMHLGLRYVPNAMEFIRRPVDGFNASIQRHEKLDVITAPANSVEYALATHSDEGKPSGLRGLLSATWTRNYAAVLLDLPPGEQPWTLEGITAANTAIVVTRLTLADVAGARHTLQLLLQHMNAEHRIPREAIFLVLNLVHDRAPMTPRTFLDTLGKEFEGWTPPVAAVIPRVDELPVKQDQGNPPTASLDEFAQGIRSIYKHLYPGMEPEVSNREKKGVFRLFH